jgi:hypothetical protein
MRNLWLVALLLVSALPCRPSQAAAPPPSPVRLLVPAYFYPAGKGMDEWRRMAKAAKDVPIIAIANPASGPGGQQDPNYVEAIDLAKQAGVTVIGYVSTSYAKRPLADVKADIDGWLKLYPKVDGFFFDEQTSGKETVPYYQALAAHAREKRKALDCLIVTNPGTVTAKEYLLPFAGINITCLHEHHTGFDRYQRPAWAADVPAAQVAGLVYNEPSLAQMREHVKTASQKGIGYFYVTDATGSNPWDRLPTYWELEVAELKRSQPAQPKPGLAVEVSQVSWTYDALQQLAQHGFPTGYPEGAMVGKHAWTRLQFGSSTRRMLEQLVALRDVPPGITKAGLKQDVRALRKLSGEYDHERDLFGMSRARAGFILRDFEALVGTLPDKK